jgi:hypothetical protein
VGVILIKNKKIYKMNFTDLQSIITDIGGGIISSGFYDSFKRILSKGTTPKSEFESNIKDILQLHNVKVEGTALITLLSKKGYLHIDGSSIKSKSSIIIGSSDQGHFLFGNNSTSETDRTKIEAGKGAYILGTGNSNIQQDENGNITFRVG